MLPPRFRHRAILVGALAAALLPRAAAATPADGDYLAATVAMHANDYPFAAEHLLRALAADPRNGLLRDQAFLAAALAGRPEAARIASGLTDNGAAALLAGNALALAGQWDEAARAYAAAPSDNGVVDAARPLLVAWAAVGAGRPDVALGTLEPLAAGGRLPGLYALEAGLIADLSHRDEEAATDYRIARGAMGGAGLDLVRVFASFEARHGRIAEATATIARLAAASPALAVAEAGIDASLQQRPVPDARAGLADSYLAIAAVVAAQSDSSTTALLLLRYALALDQRLTEARLLASDVDQSLGVPAAGLAVLEPVGPDDPLATLAALRRAELENALGDTVRARADYLALTRALPGVSAPWRALGEIDSDGGRNADAVSSFDHALADTPSGADDRWQILFDRAVARDHGGDWPRAEADLRAALDQSPDQPYVLNYLGYSFAERDGDLGQARALVEHALRAKPGDAAFLDSLGWIEVKQGDVRGGVHTLERAVEMTPEDPTVNYHLGVGYWDEGRRIEAADQWEQALILKPDAADRPRIEAHLREANAGASTSTVAGAH